MNYDLDNLERLIEEAPEASVPEDYASLKKANKQLKFSIVLTLLTLFFVVLGIWLTFGNYMANFEMNAEKVTSIYEELGEVRNENTNVYLELRKTQTEIMSLYASLENLSDRITVLDPESSSRVKLAVSALSDKLRNHSLVKSAVRKDGELIFEYPEDMVNILIVGSHSGLTDTIMVASVNPKIDEVTLISVPRDMYVNGRKINEIYHHHGVDKLKTALNDILGLQIDEYVAVDLKAFSKAIDLLGGLDIYVEKDITDYNYPTANKGYQTFNLKAGQHHMDGEMAEKYARSRKSTSDFDRARRQQKVIEAIFRKAKELGLADDKTKAVKMYNSLKEYVHTDVDIFSAITYARMFKNYEIERNNVLSNSNYLYSTINAAGSYILLPASGNYDEIKGYVFGLVVE